MPIQSYEGVVNAYSSGKSWRQDWVKQTGAAAFTLGRAYSFFTLSGNPAAGAYSGTALAAAQMTDATQGAILHGGNVSPDVKLLANQIAMTAVATGVPGLLYLVDLLLYYPQINMNVATVQNLTNGVSLPRYTTGAGVRAFLEITTASGATAHTLSMTYTDDAANGGNSLPGTVSCTASAIANHITHAGVAPNNPGPFLPLAVGDRGVRSVQSVQLSAASGAGQASLVLCRPLATIPLLATAVPVERNQIMDFPQASRIEDGACLGLIFIAGAATGASTPFIGAIETVWG
jgi:hypothetical protein